jgi:hypothetical protein
MCCPDAPQDIRRCQLPKNLSLASHDSAPERTARTLMMTISISKCFFLRSKQ